MATAAQEETGAEEQQQLAMLQRVSHRLTLCEDSRLTGVLDKLLPRMLRLLEEEEARDPPREAVKAALLQLFSDVSRRVTQAGQGEGAVRLPCDALLEVVTRAMGQGQEQEQEREQEEVLNGGKVFVNFAIVFLKMGCVRCEEGERAMLAVRVWRAIGFCARRAVRKESVLLGGLLAVFMHLLRHWPTTPTPASSPGDAGNAREHARETAEEAKGQELEAKQKDDGQDDPTTALELVRTMDSAEASAAEDIVCEVFCDIMLVQRAIQKGTAGAVQPGLSAAAADRLFMVHPRWSDAHLHQAKLGILRFLTSHGGLSSRAKVPVLLLAARTSHDVISRPAAGQLAGLRVRDPFRSDAPLAKRLLAMCLGGKENAARSPVAASYATAILEWMMENCSDGLAANAPDAIRLVFAAMTGRAAASSTLRKAVGQLNTLIASRCADKLLPVLAPLCLQAAMRTVQQYSGGGAGSAAAGATTTAAAAASAAAAGATASSSPGTYSTAMDPVKIKEHALSTISALARRSPQTFTASSAVITTLFHMLTHEESGIRIKVTECLGSVRNALLASTRHQKSRMAVPQSELEPATSTAAAATATAAPPPQSVDIAVLPAELVGVIERMVCQALHHDEYRARIAAAEWATSIYPPTHTFPWRIALILAGDPLHAVHNAAERFLNAAALRSFGFHRRMEEHLFGDLSGLPLPAREVTAEHPHVLITEPYARPGGAFADPGGASEFSDDTAANDENRKRNNDDHGSEQLPQLPSFAEFVRATTPHALFQLAEALVSTGHGGPGGCVDSDTAVVQDRLGAASKFHLQDDVDPTDPESMFALRAPKSLALASEVMVTICEREVACGAKDQQPQGLLQLSTGSGNQEETGAVKAEKAGDSQQAIAVAAAQQEKKRARTTALAAATAAAPQQKHPRYRSQGSSSTACHANGLLSDAFSRRVLRTEQKRHSAISRWLEEDTANAAACAAAVLQSIQAIHTLLAGAGAVVAARRADSKSSTTSVASALTDNDLREALEALSATSVYMLRVLEHSCGQQSRASASVHAQLLHDMLPEMLSWTALPSTRVRGHVAALLGEVVVRGYAALSDPHAVNLAQHVFRPLQLKISRFDSFDHYSQWGAMAAVAAIATVSARTPLLGASDADSQAAQAILTEQTQEVMTFALHVLESSPIEMAVVAACAFVGRVGMHAPHLFAVICGGQPERVCTLLTALLDQGRAVEPAADALGRILSSVSAIHHASPSVAHNNLSPAFFRSAHTALMTLSQLAEKREEELQFALGETIARLASIRVLYVPRGDRDWCVANVPGYVDAQFEDSLSPAGQEEEEEDKNEEKRKGQEEDTVSASEFVPVHGMVYVLHHYMFHSLLESRSPHTRGACAVWLLALVSHRAATSQVMQAALLSVQTAFVRLLGERAEFTQEVAGKGLGVVYESAQQEPVRQALLDALVTTFSSGKRRTARIAQEERGGDPEPNPGDDADTSAAAAAVAAALGGTGGSGGGGGATASTVDVVGSTGPAAPTVSAAGSSAYTEMCAVATDVGRPDLVYSFLSVASHHAAWNTRRGASFGLQALLRGPARDALRTELAGMFPKLYRYRFDPNKRVRDAMQTLWEMLVEGKESEVVEREYPRLVQEQLRSMTGNKWREREAACRAMTELLGSGRGLEHVRDYLRDTWVRTFRVVDDIRETVRVAGMDLARRVVSLSTRLCNPTEAKSETEAVEALSIVLPVVLDHGLLQPTAEARGLSMLCLVQVTRTATTALRPFLSRLTEVLLEGLSALEPRALQYMQFHTRTMGVSDEELESARLQLARTSPLQDALDHTLDQLDTPHVRDVVLPALGMLRGGVGLATREASARVLSRVLSHFPSECRALTRHMLLPLERSAVNEPSPALQRAITGAFANVLRTADEDDVAASVNRICTYYLSSADSESVDTRQRAASMLAKIASRCASALTEPDWDKVLSTTFIGKTGDEDETARANMKEAWAEAVQGAGCGTEQTAMAVTAKSVLVVAMDMTKSPSWISRRQGLRAVGDLTAHVPRELERRPKDVIPVVLSVLELLERPRIWEGMQEAAITAAKLVRACPSLARFATPPAPPSHVAAAAAAAATVTATAVEDGSEEQKDAEMNVECSEAKENAAGEDGNESAPTTIAAAAVVQVDAGVVDIPALAEFLCDQAVRRQHNAAFASGALQALALLVGQFPSATHGEVFSARVHESLTALARRKPSSL